MRNSIVPLHIRDLQESILVTKALSVANSVNDNRQLPVLKKYLQLLLIKKRIRLIWHTATIKNEINKVNRMIILKEVSK